MSVPAGMNWLGIFFIVSFILAMFVPIAEGSIADLAEFAIPVTDSLNEFVVVVFVVTVFVVLLPEGACGLLAIRFGGSTLFSASAILVSSLM